MEHKVSNKMKGILFGKLYCTDERLQMSIDKSGNYSFGLLMLCLWLGMVYGFVFDNVDIAIFSLILFLVSGIFYIVLRVRFGSFESVTVHEKKWNKKIISYVIGAFAYGAIQFVFKILDMEEYSQKNFFQAGVYSVVTAILWIFVFAGLMSLCAKTSTKRTENKIKEQNKTDNSH